MVLNSGLPAEKPEARMARVSELSEADIQRLILDMPFRKFSQRGFPDYGRDLSRVRFVPAHWRRSTPGDRQHFRDVATQAMERDDASVEPDRTPVD